MIIGNEVRKKALNIKLQEQYGFTLIEMMIVIIILGVLTMVIIPQVNVFRDDANLNTLKTNLSHMRRVIEIYYCHHNNIYPGQKKTNGIQDTSNPNEAASAFITQLTQYSDARGETKEIKDATHIFGPYIKKGVLPQNPFNDKNDITCDITTTDIAVMTSDGSTGWKFYSNTGVIIPNHGIQDPFVPMKVRHLPLEKLV